MNNQPGRKFSLAGAANEALKHLDQAERLLRQIPTAGLINAWTSDESAQTGGKRTFEEFLDVARDLDSSLKTFAEFTDDAASELPIRLLREWHQAFRQMLDGRQNVWLDFSPVVRTPRLTVGPSHLMRPFEALWDSCRAAGLLSGTLYLPNADGRLSSGFLRMKLCVPRERALEINPVHPSWNFTAPTIYLPGEATARALTYPGTAEDEGGASEVHRWHETLAGHLSEISATALGGTLVLCCSYIDVRALSALLTDGLGGRLLSSLSGGSLRTSVEEFIQQSRKKARPVWLATGSAWTRSRSGGPRNVRSGLGYPVDRFGRHARAVWNQQNSGAHSQGQTPRVRHGGDGSRAPAQARAWASDSTRRRGWPPDLGDGWPLTRTAVELLQAGVWPRLCVSSQGNLWVEKRIAATSVTAQRLFHTQEEPCGTLGVPLRCLFLAVPAILAGGAAMMAVAGILFFHEPPSWQRLLGVALALAGLFLLRK